MAALDVTAGREFRLGTAGAGFVAVGEILGKVVHWALRGLGSHDFHVSSALEG
jgi:hypothetical protein